MARQYFPITLPGARLYRPDIQIRQFGPDEVESYYNIRRTNSIPSLRSLVGGTLKNITIDELYEPDFLFIMYWHRVNSYMNFPFTIPWICPMCDNNNTTKLDLTKMVSTSIAEDYPPDGVTLDLPCGLPITFRLPKETDDSRATEQVRLLQIENVTEGHLRKAELLAMMEFEANYAPMEKWDFINKAFTPEDIFVIDGFKRMFRYGPDNLMEVKCDKCSSDQRVSFRFSIFEFFPTSADLANIRTRILPNKPSKLAAKRAKEALFPKTTLVAPSPPEGVRPLSQSEREPGGSGQYPPGPTDEESILDQGTSGLEDTVRPNPILQGNAKLRPITPNRLAQQVLEEATHAGKIPGLDLELEKPPQVAPSRFDSLAKR
jgi:hypothetical protein